MRRLVRACHIPVQRAALRQRSRQVPKCAARLFATDTKAKSWQDPRPKEPPRAFAFDCLPRFLDPRNAAPKPKEMRYREELVDSELMGRAPSAGEEDRPVTHKEIVDMLRENDVIQSEKVYKVCWDINPHHFSMKPKEETPGVRRAYEGFAEEEASYTAEEWAEAMVIFIGIMEQFSSFLRPGMKVLDVGSGTGYNTAALAHLVGPTGLVVAVERSEEMIKHAESVLKKHHPDLLQRIQFVNGDGMKGYPNGAPFDAIHVEGAVRGTIRKTWIDQLRNGGILIGPFVQADEESGGEVQMLRMMRKIEGTTFEQVDLMEVDFEELISSEPSPGAQQAPRRPKTSILDREELEFEEVSEDDVKNPVADKPYQ